MSLLYSSSPLLLSSWPRSSVPISTALLLHTHTHSPPNTHVLPLCVSINTAAAAVWTQASTGGTSRGLWVLHLLEHTWPLEKTALKRPCRHLRLPAQWLMWRHKLSSMPRWVFLSILCPSLSWILSHISICNMICLFFLIPTPFHYDLSQILLLPSTWVKAKCFKQLRSAGTFKETASDCLRMWCSKWQVWLLCNSPTAHDPLPLRSSFCLRYVFPLRPPGV